MTKTTKHVIFILLVTCLLLVSCSSQFESKSTYFEGDVSVEYFQTRQSGHDDYLTFMFYDEGTYKVTFERTPDKSSRGEKYMPEGFTITIDEAPREHIVRQYILPDFLRITIVRDEETTEFHDFQ